MSIHRAQGSVRRDGAEDEDLCELHLVLRGGGVGVSHADVPGEDEDGADQAEDTGN